MKKVTMSIRGMKCIGCMNTVKMKLKEIDGVEDVLMDLVPGTAVALVENSTDSRQMINRINNETQYVAGLVGEEEIDDELLY